MNDNKIKQWVQIALLVWFIIASLFVFVPSAILLFNASPVAADPVEMPRPPTIPEPPKLDPALKTDQVTAYDKYVTAQLNRYDKELNVYKERLGAGGTYESRNDLISVYKVVVNDVLEGFIEKMIAALLAFAFVKVALDLVAEWRVRRSDRY
jgi:hypothetical protein